jgi:hypothetical protein
MPAWLLLLAENVAPRLGFGVGDNSTRHKVCQCCCAVRCQDCGRQVQHNNKSTKKVKLHVLASVSILEEEHTDKC